MSLIVVYHDARKAIIASDDRMCREDSVTFVKHRIDGRISKIIMLPRNIVFGSVGRVDLNQSIYTIGVPPGAASEKYFSAKLQVMYSVNQNNLAGAAGLNVSGLQAGVLAFSDGGGVTFTPFAGSIFTVNGAGPVGPTLLSWGIPAGTNLSQIVVYIDATSVPSLTSGALKIRIHSARLLVVD